MENNFGQGTNIKRPAELDLPNMDPALRAQVLDHYTAALMDRPSSSLNAQEKASIQEQINAVLKGMGHGG